jgi:RHS repeat-associated protein
MRQQGWKPGSIGNALIDNMVYGYRPGSNKLAKVTDATDDPMAKMGDFKDGANTGDDYDYDVNGNMTTDNNKNISSIQYNHLNLPQTITVTGKGVINYTYDAAGTKLKKITTDNTVTPAKTTTTEYISGFVYENGVLQFTGHEEGRLRYAKQYFVNGDSAWTWQWDYFLKDHLGNIRTVLTEQKDTAKYAATFETALRPKETALFYNIPETVVARGATNAPADPALPTPNDYLSVLEGADHKAGAAITLKVMAGDKVDMGVRYWYPSYSTVQQANPLSTSNLYQVLLGSLSGGTATLSGGKTTPAHLLGAGSPMPGGLTNYLGTQNGEPDTAGKPKAFINWILLDEQFNYVPQGSGFMRVGDYDAAWRSLAKTELPIVKSGYLFVYLSNETQHEKVFFDNLTIQHYTGPLTEETNYYPFGLTMGGISSKAVGKVENKFKFNGYEENKSLDLNWLESFYRTYDPQLGRFWQVDPKPTDFESLYAAMGNNPVLKADPLGDTASVKWGTGFLGLKRHAAKYVNGQWIDAKSRTKIDVNSVNKQSVRNRMNDYTKLNSINEFAPYAKIINESSIDVSLASTGRGSQTKVNKFFNKGGSLNVLINENQELNAGVNINRQEVKLPSYIIMGHELGHAVDVIQGKGRNFFETVIEKYNIGAVQLRIAPTETNAMYIENLLRIQAGLPIRNYYTHTSVPASNNEATRPGTIHYVNGRADGRDWEIFDLNGNSKIIRYEKY